MKLSDYIADFLVKEGVNHVFVVSGGAAVHMIDSAARNPELDYICAQHEQHAGAEADGYARIGNRLGAAMVTSGPGGTNLATSIANAFYDSIPVLFLCGQVASFRLRKSEKLRQKGFQETDVVSMFKPVTKYAVRIIDPQNIRFELEKAVYYAREGRPGPVVLDIPDDFFRSDIDPFKLKKFIPPKQKTNDIRSFKLKIKKLEDYILKSKRPVVILGAGIDIARARNEVIEFIEYFGIPATRTYGGASVIPSSHRLNIGTIGIAGTRSGNFAVQTSDLIIAIGTRLSPNVTGGKQNLFAPYARKIMIDVDQEELSKFGDTEFLLDLAIRADIKDFFKLFQKLYKINFSRSFDTWLRQIKVWVEKYPICPAEYYTKAKQIQPHVFVKELSLQAAPGDVIVADTGANLCWVLQTWETKKNQQIISAWSHTPMGYALPAAIGASFTTKGNVLCLIGDGGLMMCLQELATVVRHKLPIKIFIFNNHGHSIQKQTVETWLAGSYQAVDEASGLSFPDFGKIGEAFGIKTITLKSHNELKNKLKYILNYSESILVNVEIDPDARIVPMLKFGAGLEDLDPKIPKEELAKIMKIGS